MKIITIVGARPQFIKAATISRAIANSNKSITEIIVHTGQHYDANMSEIFFGELDIPMPHYNLNIGGGKHGENTGRMLEAIELVLIKEQPDWVLVYGDTDSTLAGALAAAKLNIKIAHVESGLRSFNKNMPEEINRVITDHISSLLFTPCARATKNLLAEGINLNKIEQVGDVMYDAAVFYKTKAKPPQNVNLSAPYILATIHRAENTNATNKLIDIFSALNYVAQKINVILPLHPRTRKILELNKIDTHNIKILDPVGYLEMVWLIKNSNFIITDSGGLQKEAYFFEKPCIVTREETEWTELVESGKNILTGTNNIKIIEALESASAISFNNEPEIYGTGQAAKNIVDSLLMKDINK